MVLVALLPNETTSAKVIFAAFVGVPKVKLPPILIAVYLEVILRLPTVFILPPFIFKAPPLPIAFTPPTVMKPSLMVKPPG